MVYNIVEVLLIQRRWGIIRIVVQLQRKDSVFSLRSVPIVILDRKCKHLNDVPNYTQYTIKVPYFGMFYMHLRIASFDS